MALFLGAAWAQAVFYSLQGGWVVEQAGPWAKVKHRLSSVT